MFKLLLISIVAVPVLLGMGIAARVRNGQRALLALLAAIVTYDVLYMFVVYYLRVRWLGWG